MILPKIALGVWILVDLGGNRATISKSGTQTRGLSPLFLKPFVYW